MAQAQQSLLTEMASKHERLLARLAQSDALANLVMFTTTQVLIECCNSGKMLDEVRFDTPQIVEDKLIYQFWFVDGGKIIVRPPLQRGSDFVQFNGKYNRAMSEAVRHESFIKLFSQLVERFDNFAAAKSKKLSEVDIEKAGLAPDRTFFAQLKIREAIS
jgi:hypothetical protein